MQNTRWGWIPIVIAALPLVAVILHFMTPNARWLWQVNFVPMAFVLSNNSYMNDCHVRLTFEDDSVAVFNRSAIGQKMFHLRLDKTMFSHFVRQGRTQTSETPAHFLRRLFCASPVDNKKVARFEFTITSNSYNPLLRETVECY